MLTNIRGLVERLELSASKALMPLFEAISNAMDAVEERTGQPASGSIRIRLIPAFDLMRQAGDETFVVNGFEVTDDGVGFNETNMASFGEAYTRSKVKVGGKGVGRFTFLKVFSSVRIRSVFNRDGRHIARDFQFSIDEELKGTDRLTPSDAPLGTTVICEGMYEPYRAAWPSDPFIVAQRIVAHFLI